MSDLYFVWDPINHELETYRTKERQDKAAEEIIEYCKDDSGRWMAEIDEVVAGIITSRATPSNITTRPKNISLEEDGIDENGIPWDKGIDTACTYEMRPVSKEGER